MNSFQKWVWPILGLTIFGALILGRFQPFSNEPVYHGRTVTQWLDRMALFDGPRHMVEEEGDRYHLPESPSVIQNDPALKALLAMGSKAVPTLGMILNQPPEWPPGSSMDRAGAFVKWKWDQMRNSVSSSPPSVPHYFSKFQDARKMAAGLALLALGTNCNAGALRLIAISAAAPRDDSGGDHWFYANSFVVARNGLPERHAEIVSGILSGLAHTNVTCQIMAISLTTLFPADFPVWRKTLMKLAQDSNPNIRKAALSRLAFSDPKNAEIMALCEKNLRDKTNPSGLRGLAAAGLGMAEEKAGHDLPLLREALTEQGLPRGSGLPREARLAIERIEKSIVAKNQNHPSLNPANR